MRKTLLLLITIVFLGTFLRFYRLALVPPSLYWDEASLGYNAFAIATTLHDEHGEFLPIARFIAFGDYKPSGYIYAAALSIKAFGPTELAVRLPSALSGIGLIILAFFLTSLLFKKEKVALTASLLVAVSPWAIQMSRGAFEANLATLFSGLGIYCLIRFFNRQQFYLLITSALGLAFSMYTFNTHRIFVPAIVILILLLKIGQIFSNKWITVKIGFFVTLVTLLVLPMVPHLLSREGRLRFDEVSWTKDTVLVEQSNTRVAREGNSTLSKILDNRRINFALQFVKHYADHFDPNYLFTKGDVNGRLSTGAVGEFYLIESLFLVTGIYYLIRHRSNGSIALMAWLLIGLVPAAFARETPHALRTLNLIPAAQIIAALGLVAIVSNLKLKKVWTTVIITAYVLSVFSFLTYYFGGYSVKTASQWQYGYKQMVTEVNSIKAHYSQIRITGQYGRPYIYLLFYSNYPPEKYLATRKAERDWYGFWTVSGFDKFSFDQKTPYPTTGKILFVAGKGEIIPSNAKIIKKINDLSSEPVFILYEN